MLLLLLLLERFFFLPCLILIIFELPNLYAFYHKGEIDAKDSNVNLSFQNLYLADPSMSPLC